MSRHLTDLDLVALHLNQVEARVASRRRDARIRRLNVLGKQDEPRDGALNVVCSPGADEFRPQEGFDYLVLDPERGAHPKWQQGDFGLVLSPGDPATVLPALEDYFLGTDEFALAAFDLICRIEGGGGVDGILTEAQRSLGRSLACIDATLSHLAGTPLPKNLQPVLEESLSESRLVTEGVPGAVATIVVDGTRLLATRVRVSSRRSVALVMWNPRPGTSPGVDAAILTHLSLYVGDYLGSGKGHSLQEEADLLLEDLLMGVAGSPRQVLHRADTCGITFRDSARIISFFRYGADATMEQAERTLTLVRSAYPQSATTIHERHAIAVVPTHGNTSKILGIIGSPQVRTMGIDLRCSVSMTFDSFEGIAEAYQQCAVAQEMGTMFEPYLSIFRYSRYLFPALIRDAEPHLELGRYVLPIARQIIDYDRTHNTPYAATLYRYIASNKADDVARDLHVHRNTVVYRLGKIRDLFGIDYEDGGRMANIKVSFDVLVAIPHNDADRKVLFPG